MYATLFNALLAAAASILTPQVLRFQNILLVVLVLVMDSAEMYSDCLWERICSKSLNLQRSLHVYSRGPFRAYLVL